MKKLLFMLLSITTLASAEQIVKITDIDKAFSIDAGYFSYYVNFNTNRCEDFRTEWNKISTANGQYQYVATSVYSFPNILKEAYRQSFASISKNNISVVLTLKDGSNAFFAAKTKSACEIMRESVNKTVADYKKGKYK